MGPIETSISDAEHAVVHAQNDRSCLGHIETCYSCPKVAVFHPKTTRGLGPIETIYSGANQAVLNAKTTDDVWNQ